jgi:hypothetical protein
MNNIWIIVMVAAILIVFLVILLKDGPPQRKRRDDRDAKKSDDIQRNPALEYKMQQPAELQVGEKEEAREPRRFEPDAQANQKWEQRNKGLYDEPNLQRH